MFCPVPTLKNASVEDVKKQMNQRKPLLIRHYDIGRCTQTWSPQYVSNKVGNAPVKIHVSPSGNMDFINKNFLYKTLPFDELISRTSQSNQNNYFIHANELYYLRSLGSDPRGREVSNLSAQFPELAKDLKIPEFFDQEDFFSSVIRVSSSGIRLWTHYDIMDNILIQVRGRKKIVLWPPTEVEGMYLAGDKSTVLEVDNPDTDKFPKFKGARRYECTLEPGDIIFIPAMWFHNTLALDSGIAINVFWKNLDHELYDKKDPYGNKDVLPGAKALQMLENGIKALQVLPQEYKDFYIQRMIESLKSNLSKSEQEAWQIDSNK